MATALVGMSGGVDSSVTAYLLKEEGYDVQGLSFILWEARNRNDFRTCCSLQAIHDASETAEKLGISHHVFDARKEFLEKVIEPFIDIYENGSTPNPCVLCNRHIKFPILMEEAEKKGIDYIATGHYARVARNGGQVLTFDINKAEKNEQMLNDESYVKCQGLTPLLKKGIDTKKDQSYFLYVLTRKVLDRLLLPLGYYTKDMVREIANKLKLPAAQREESQEICFVEDRDYQKFIKSFLTDVDMSGSIVDMEGKTIGTHHGLYAYTIGQRRGLGLSAKEPFYVVKMDTEKNTLVVGARENAMKKEFLVRAVNWLVPYAMILKYTENSSRVKVKFR